MKTVCETNKCTGCMACLDICPRDAITVEDSLSAYNAVIQEDKCIDCGRCRHICPDSRLAEAAEPIEWHQGWAEDSCLRENGSSGGIATAISMAFIESGGIVCGCMLKGGQFIYDISDDVKDLGKFAGSKYVKSNPAGVYKKVADKLKAGHKVLFIGLPCHVSAMKNFVLPRFSAGLYTADLVCHGTPSPRLLEMFLNQYGRSLTEIQNIRFRAKAKFYISSNNKGIIPTGVMDKYSIAFLNSLTYTENCYACPYAKWERVSDLTLGDSWGSDLTMEEQKKGISLALCQTEKGKELLKNAGVVLKTVDIEKAVANNQQLKCPTAMKKERGYFFRKLQKRHRFNLAVFKCLPYLCFRQEVKQLLMKIGAYNQRKE